MLPLEYTTTSYDVPGRDGTVAFPTNRRQSVLNLVVKSPLEHRGTLLALMSGPTLKVTHIDRPGQEAVGRLLSSSVEAFHEAKGWAKDLFVVEIPSGSWRDVSTTTTTAVDITQFTVNSTFFSGISAPVQDALIRIKGPVTDVQVQDSGGSFMKIIGSVASGVYVRFDMKTGRAWATTTDTWSGGTEVTGDVDFGGPRSYFEITPHLQTPTDPSVRVAKLTTTATVGGGQLQVRGKSAYLL